MRYRQTYPAVGWPYWNVTQPCHESEAACQQDGCLPGQNFTLTNPGIRVFAFLDVFKTSDCFLHLYNP